MNSELNRATDNLTVDSVREMLLLAERLREANNGVLDDEAILAVSEATGVPEEVVRATASRLPEGRKRGSAIHQIRHAILALDPDVRRYAASGLLATNLGLLNVVAVAQGDQYGFIGILAIVLFFLGIWNLTVVNDNRTAMLNGALFGGLFFVARSAFSMIFHTQDRIPSILLIPHILVGLLGGVALHTLYKWARTKAGLKDPQEERQHLLKQLVDLQDKLRSGEQAMSFLSLDIVGSTKMKEVADPLSVEFTFTEYHKWVEWVAKRFGGKIHSTAGDGIICAFDDPIQAFSAAKYVQTGLVELNTFRNKIGIPIQLRIGLHHGAVNAPAGSDVTKINFAHVIDIAAHLQKASPVGGIAVSEAAAEKLPGGPTSIGSTSVEVSNVRAFVWQSRAQMSTLGGGPPPMPA